MTISSRITGQIDPNEVRQINMTIFGKMFMMFRNWIPALATERWGGLRYNQSLDDFKYGRYTAFVNTWKGHTLQALGNMTLQVLTFSKAGKFDFSDKNLKIMYDKFMKENPQYKGKFTFEEFKESREQQLRALATELRMWIATLTLFLLAKGDDEDDEEKEGWRNVVS